MAFRYENSSCSESVHIRFVVGKVALGQISFQGSRLCSISTISGMLHTHRNLRIHVALARRANGRSPGNLPKSNVPSEIGGYCIENFLVCRYAGQEGIPDQYTKQPFTQTNHTR
jgi:hypothetical protein